MNKRFIPIILSFPIIIDRSGAMIGKAIGPRPWNSPAAGALFEHLIANPPERGVSGGQHTQ